VKRYSLLTFCFIILSAQSFCQDKKDTGARILFHGLVMDAKTEFPLTNSQIGINGSFYSVTDKEGKFAFLVNRSDTVIFSRLGYKPVILYVSDTLLGKEFITGIYMHVDTLSISEVVIVPRMANLKSEILNPRTPASPQIEYAKDNLAVSAYQGRVSQGKMGDPSINYGVLRQKQRMDAYSKGQIPSDQIAAISPLMLLPAAYLLLHGLPEKPPPLQPRLTEQEINQIHRKYLETLTKKK
jgi:hypothetical protein